jgi:hypothetical protein
VSFQLSILKILAGQPDGRASTAVVRQYLELFYTSGPDWTNRMKRLAAIAPDLDIFGQQLISHRPGEWRITEKGRAILDALERSLPVETKRPKPEPDWASMPIKALPQLGSRPRKRASRSSGVRKRKSG